MELVHSDVVEFVPPGTTPDYDTNNSLEKLVTMTESLELAASAEWYLRDSLQYLIPIGGLTLYGPSGGDANVLDPTKQDNKTDFQKQNVKAFTVVDTIVTRGLVTLPSWTGPFIRLSYRGGPDSELSKLAGGTLSASIKVWLRVGTVVTPAPLTVPYNARANRYEIELWGYTGADLAAILQGRAANALTTGELVARPDLVQGNASDFTRESLDGKATANVSPADAMHPILPLHLEVAWSNADGSVWDSLGGANHHFEFTMIQRGWDQFLSVGTSTNPHGGVGTLDYRNLLSTYGQFAAMTEIGRQLEAWNFDAFGQKNGRYEPFFAVNYADLHIIKPLAGIGLHRHRDNAEVFFMMKGRGMMVVGDWCKFPNRERCFELRLMQAGDMVMLRGGNLHGLMNVMDETAELFMFGGYD